MRKSMLAKRVAAIACAAVVALFAFAGSAFAATVHGADCHGTGSVLQAGEVEVLEVDGNAGETVFFSVKRGGTDIAKNLPYTVERDSNAAEGMMYAGVATLDISGLDLNSLDGSYTIEAYGDRMGENLLYSGALYGVYADLPDGTQKLIGTRTANSVELTARTFDAPQTLFDNPKTYRLAGEGTASDGGVMHFPYVDYDEAKTVDGVIKYVDSAGTTIATTPIPGLKPNEKRTVEVPTVVKADNGSLYRTVYFENAVTAENPGATSFSIYCVEIAEEYQALAGYYVATILMVDDNGNVIARDTVDVTGEFLYTAPTTIYKSVTDNGEASVVTYTIVGSPTVRLSAANDGVLNRERTIEVSYTASKADDKEVDVAYTLIDGSKRVGEEGRVIGSLKAKATKDAPAVPEAQIEVGGTTYHIAGSVDDYAYAVGSGAVPAIDVYYTPEGYTPPGAYEVTVNYVNFRTNSVVESHKYTSDPNENARILISTPESFSAGGVDYVRLAGQEDDIAHSYYSGIAAYTVYYRDRNDTLISGVVINRIRVVYADGSVEGGAEAGAGADAATAGGATSDDVTALGLNGESTYNVMDGDGGNATLTNEAGVDSNTERIVDSETPLASGFDKGGSSGAASSFAQTAQTLIPICLGVFVVLAIVAVIVMRRRKAVEEYEL